MENMLKDAQKVFSMRKSGSNIRSFWNIGVFKREEIYNIDLIKNLILNDYRIETDINLIKINEIKTTGFNYLIF